MAVINLTEDNYSEVAEKSDELVVVDFFANWCGPCMMLKPIFSEVSEKFDGKVVFTKVDCDKFKEPAQKFNVDGIPCLVFMKNGEEVDRQVGFLDADALAAKVEEVLSKQ